MSPEQLLQRLESMGIDAKVIRKIRAQVEEHNQNSQKAAKPQAILKFLVQKGIIDQSVADDILEESPSLSAATANQPRQDDISDLIAGFDTPPPSKPEPQITIGTPAPVEEIAKPKKAPDRDKKKKTAKSADKGPDKESAKPTKKTVANAETVYDPNLLDEYLAPAGEGRADNDFGGFDSSDMVEPNQSQLPTFRGKRDKRNQWATKWLYIASTIIGLLAIFGAVLALATMGISADEKYTIAMESLDRLAYLDAAKKFEDYYTAHPNHKNVSAAKAYRVQALIRSHDQNKNYEEAIRTADNLLPPILDDEQGKIDELRDDLAVVLPRALFLITEDAKKAYQIADLRKGLERCERLKEVIDNVAYIPTSQRNKPTTADYLTRIDNNIKAIKTQIDKEEQYQQAIIDIKELGEALKTNEAFATYRKLTRNFGDLAARDELRHAIQEVSLKEQQLVTPIEATFELSNQARPSPIIRTFVLSRPNGNPVESLKDETFCFLVDGSVYGMRGSDGAILWRRFVGYQTQIQPIAIDKDRLLVSDLQEYDLILADQSSGDVVWRLEVGEPFLAPAFNDAMIILTTKGGKILKIDPATGAVTRAVKLPQSATVSAMITDREPYVYQMGAHSNFYVLSKEDLSCREVFYLGHEPGSIAVPPAFWSGMIVVAVNRGNSCDLWGFRPDATGLALELIQVLNVFRNGIVTSPIQRYGAWLLVASTQGEVQILELLTTEEAQSAPLTRFASELFENSGAKTFLLTEGNNIWIAGLELSRIKLQRAQSKLTRETISNAGDLFLTPLQRIDDYVLHVRRRKGSGMISTSLVDAMKLEQVWRVDFGGVVPGAPVGDETGLSIVSNQGDLFRIDNRSNVNVLPVAIGSRTVESLRFQHVVPLGEAELAVIGVSGQREMIYGKDEQGQLFGLAPPADQSACRPLQLGPHIIVPSSEGPIVRINPSNGQMVGTPFMPPVAAGRKTVWYDPTLLNQNRFAIVNGASEGSESKLYLISGENEGALTELNSFKPPFPFKSPLSNDGNLIFAAVEGPVSDQLLAISIDNLTIQQQVEVPGRVVAGPWIVGGGLLVKMDNDQMVMLEMSLANRWNLSVPNDRFAGIPEVMGNEVLISFQSGQLLFIDESTGKISREYSLRQPIVSSPVRVGSTLFCSGLDGTVHEIDLSHAAGVN